jgi:hypothetical protein
MELNRFAIRRECEAPAIWCSSAARRLPQGLTKKIAKQPHAK